MSWKDDIKDTVARMDLLMKEIVILYQRIEKLETTLGRQVADQSRAADRMADRMIEMAMVRQGAPDMAATHRRTLDEKPVEGTDLWQDSPEEQWPPPGCTEVRMP